MEKKIFEKTDGIRGKFGEEPVTLKTFEGIANAVGRYLGKGGVVFVGRDSRKSGEELRDVVEKGLVAAGRVVWDLGVLSTPCLAYLVKVTPEAVGGIMITASHNPAHDNGMKVFDERGDKFTDEMELAVEALFFEAPGTVEEGACEQKYGLKEQYEAALVEKGAKPASMKVCVDSASGGAWELSKGLFERLGVDFCELSQRPDGDNINQTGALHAELLSEGVLTQGADIGIALDGDADRIILVDELGQIWDGDRIVAMLAENWGLSEVVLTEYSNLGAVQYLESKGIKVEKVLVGDKEVAYKCQTQGIRLGGEAAGHVIDLTWLSSSDGLYTAMQVLKIMQERGVKMSELMPKYEMFPQKIWNIGVREKIPLEEVAGWEDEFRRQSEYLGTEGRAFARYSGTEKKLRIMVESTNLEKMMEVGEVLSNLIKKEIDL